MDEDFAQRQFDAQIDAQLRRRRNDDDGNLQGVAEDEPPIMLDNEDNQAAAILNLNLGYRYLPSYFSVAFSVIGGYLCISYALTTVIGYVLNFFYFKIASVMFNGILVLFSRLKLPYYERQLALKWPIVATVEKVSFVYLISPILELYHRIVEGSPSSSILLRTIPPASTYLTFILLCCIIPEVISKGFSKRQPLKDPLRRTIFRVTYIIKCSLKTLTLFTLELAGFPIFAGLLIDLSLISPMLQPQDKLLFIPGFCSTFPAASVVVYWAIGTLYMYRFAQFVGMIRQYIIRPGVLSFIRSPEDPNIKLVQDSLIYPMKLQLSRLVLSMAIYVAFIVLGFGLVTRLLFPFILKSELLPMKNDLTVITNLYSLFGNLAIGCTDTILSKNRTINIYVRQYWVFVFNICCRKLRLSSFILGKDSPTERGQVVYRNMVYKWLRPKVAEYSNLKLYSHPKSLIEAKTLFKEDDSIHAYFVPDGTMMRVPGSDIISKRYAQLLFVPVTKDDKLLKPIDVDKIKERQKKNAGEFGYLEKQITDFDEYAVVYVPPHFTLAYSLLIVFIWLFSALLFIAVLLLANVIGITLIATLEKVITQIPSSLVHSVSTPGFVSRFRRLDLYACCIGLVVQSRLLTTYHSYLLDNVNRHQRIVEVGNENDGFIEGAVDIPDQPNINNENPAERIHADINVPAQHANVENIRMEGRAPEGNMWTDVKRFASTIYPLFVFHCVPYLFRANIRYHSFFLFFLFKSYFHDGGSSIKEIPADQRDYDSLASYSAMLTWKGYSSYSLMAVLFSFLTLTISYLSVKVIMKRNKNITKSKLLMSCSFSIVLFLASMLAVPFSLQYFFCGVEYMRNKKSYTSLNACFIYFTVVKPFVSSALSSLSLVEQAFYMTDVLFVPFVVLLSICSLWKVNYEAMSQSIRDELYARGRVLKNYEG